MRSSAPALVASNGRSTLPFVLARYAHARWPPGRRNRNALRSCQSPRRCRRPLGGSAAVESRGRLGRHEALRKVIIDKFGGALQRVAVAGPAAAFDADLVATIEAHVGEFGRAFGPEGLSEGHASVGSSSADAHPCRPPGLAAEQWPRPMSAVIHQHAR